MVDVKATQVYVRGGVMDYPIDRRLPKNTTQIIIEIDREISKKRGIYTGFMRMDFFYSEDGQTWVQMDGGGCYGGIESSPELKVGEEIVREARENPITSCSLGNIPKYQGNYFKLRISSDIAQTLPYPRILIGLGK